MDNTIKDRRPIKARESGWARFSARWLQKKGATPNGISVASSVCAALGGLFFLLAFRVEQPIFHGILLVLAVVAIQARLICNLLDGMVAVEGGLRSPAGPVFNDLPDRISDTLILVGLGYGLPLLLWSSTLGWMAALFAALTAYVRLLGATCGLPQQFLGPMAKQHRMALLSVCGIVAAFLPLDWGQWLLGMALVVITLGAAWTVWRRTRSILLHLKENA